MSNPIRSHFVLAHLAFAASIFAAPVPSPRNPRPKPAISAPTAARVKKISELTRDVWEIVWGPRRGEVSLLAWEQPVEVLDGGTFHPVRKIGAKKRLIHFAVSADGNRMALAENSTKVEIRDLAGKKTVVIDTKNDQPASAFSPNGKLLATGGYGTKAKLWDAASGKEIRSFDAGTAGGLTAVFSPDGKLLAVGNRNDRTHLYEVATGKLRHTLPQKMSHELKFSPDGRVLAVAYVDGRVGLWDVAAGNLLRDRATGASEVYTLDWSRKGDVLATAGAKGKIVLWNAADLSVLKELEAPEWVIRVRFSPDGDRLLSAGGTNSPSRDKKVVVWGLIP